MRSGWSFCRASRVRKDSLRWRRPRAETRRAVFFPELFEADARVADFFCADDLPGALFVSLFVAARADRDHAKAAEVSKARKVRIRRGEAVTFPRERFYGNRSAK